MIVYNNRYRGPMEYDKFILNTLQYINEVNAIYLNEFKEVNGYTNLLELHKQFSLLYEKAINSSEQLYLSLLNLKEV